MLMKAIAGFYDKNMKINAINITLLQHNLVQIPLLRKVNVKSENSMMKAGSQSSGKNDF